MTLYKIKIKISKENLERFLKELIGFHPSIKFTFEKSKMKVNFLVVAVKTKNGRLSTDLYSKPVDSHQYPQYNSCQAEHIQTLLFTIKGEENLLKDQSSQVPSFLIHVIFVIRHALVSKYYFKSKLNNRY